VSRRINHWALTGVTDHMTLRRALRLGSGQSSAECSPTSRLVRRSDDSLRRLSTLGRLLAVAHTDRDDTIRIISARLVTPGERQIYEEG
jgi:hypothetical protein